MVLDAHTAIAHTPAELDLAVAGTLGLAGAAAVDSVTAFTPQPGQTVLISGATGGVGALAVQYTAAARATVIATARPGAETELVRDLGATQTVDYTQDLAPQVRAIAPDGVDAVIHLTGDGAALSDLLHSKGHLASTLGFGPQQHHDATAVMANPALTTLETIADDVTSGRIRIPITATYTLDNASQGFADFAPGSLGKLAIRIS